MSNLSKAISSVVIAIFLTILATPSQAQESKLGFYIGGKVIGTMQHHWLGSGIHVDSLASVSFTGNWAELGFGGAALVGYDFHPRFSIPLRLDLEYIARTTWNGGFEIGVVDEGEKLSASLDTKLNIQTLMLNASLDWHNESIVTPYITAGVGFAFAHGKLGFNVEDPSSFIGANFSHSESESLTSLAWQVGVGMGIDLTESLTFDVGYRYFQFGVLDYENTANSFSKIDSTVKVSTLNVTTTAHELSIGLRYTF